MKVKQAVVKKLKEIWNDESAQGATEYILLIALVVGIVMLFRKQITGIIESKLGEIGTAIGGFKPEGQ